MNQNGLQEEDNNFGFAEDLPMLTWCFFFTFGMVSIVTSDSKFYEAKVKLYIGISIRMCI